MNDAQFTIGQLARATDTKSVTIRYYEQQGLLAPPVRTPSGYRLYSAQERLQRAGAGSPSIHPAQPLTGLQPG